MWCGWRREWWQSRHTWKGRSPWWLWWESFGGVGHGGKTLWPMRLRLVLVAFAMVNILGLVVVAFLTTFAMFVASFARGLGSLIPRRILTSTSRALGLAIRRVAPGIVFPLRLLVLLPLRFATCRRNKVGVCIFPTGTAMTAIVGCSLCSFAAVAALPRIVRHLLGDSLQEIDIFRMVLAEGQLQAQKVWSGQSYKSTTM